MSFGSDDPSIAWGAAEAHRAALASGAGFYLDPATGFAVMTAERLQGEGSCCGNSCRHCPFSAEEQRLAGRSSQRPD